MDELQVARISLFFNHDRLLTMLVYHLQPLDMVITLPLLKVDESFAASSPWLECVFWESPSVSWDPRLSKVKWRHWKRRNKRLPKDVFKTIFERSKNSKSLNRSESSGSFAYLSDQ